MPTWLPWAALLAVIVLYAVWFSRAGLRPHASRRRKQAARRRETRDLWSRVPSWAVAAIGLVALVPVTLVAGKACGMAMEYAAEKADSSYDENPRSRLQDALARAEAGERRSVASARVADARDDRDAIRRYGSASTPGEARAFLQAEREAVQIVERVGDLGRVVGAVEVLLRVRRVVGEEAEVGGLRPRPGHRRRLRR